MAQSYVQQQTNWITQFQQLSMQLLEIADKLETSTGTFSDQQFGTGGANAITDPTATAAIPQAIAQTIWSAEGAVVAILGTIASNRGYLEAIRP